MGIGGSGRGRRWGLIVPIGALGLVILAPLAALLATTWVMGWRLQVVTTASMNPLYPAGTLVAVEPLDAAAPLRANGQRLHPPAAAACRRNQHSEGPATRSS